MFVYETSIIRSAMKDIRFAYYSKPSKEFRCTGIESILSAARKNNERLDVTGLLVQTPTHFMQVLEGRREAVSQILSKLMTDPRHTDVTLYGAAGDRLDAGSSSGTWAMSAPRNSPKSFASTCSG